MTITEKNKVVREITKTDFFKNNFKNKITLKITKEHHNSSRIKFIVKNEYLNEFFTPDREKTKHSDLWELTLTDVLKNKLYPKDNLVKLYTQIREITDKGVTYYETGDYGNQPSEYWWFRVLTDYEYNLYK